MRKPVITLSTLWYAVLLSITSVNADEAYETISVTEASSSRMLYQSLSIDTQTLTPRDLSTQTRSVADIIALSSGMNYNGQGGLFQSYNIRGFSKSRIVTEVDGIPIITDRRAGNSAAFIPGNAIGNVYLQKGPSAMLYGSDAMGGVVALSTDIVESGMSLSYQGVDEAQEFSAQLTGDQLSGALIHRQADNSESSNGEILNSQYQQTFAKVSAEFSFDDLFISANSLYSRGRDIGKSSALYQDERITIYPQDDHWLNSVTFSDRQGWKVTAYHHNQDWNSDVARINDNQEDRRNITRYQAQTVGSYGSYVIENLTVGAQWLGRRNIKIIDNEYNSAAQLQWRKETVNASQDTWALYANYVWEADDWLIKAGVRVDSVSVKNSIENARQQRVSDEFLSLSLVSKYHWSQETSVLFQLANAFRFPSVSELFFSGQTPRGNTQGNDKLTPETSLGYQLSLNHQLDRNLNLVANAYYYDIDDYIERYRLSDGSRSYRNTAQVTSIGAEVILDWQISSQFNSELGLQYQRNEDLQGDGVDDALPTALKWQLSWHYGPWRIKNQFTYQWRQSQVGPSEQQQRAVGVDNFTVEYALTEQMLISAAVYNLTDQLYKASADEDAAYQPRRALNLTWRWSF